jgi:anthranilate phosphoribosyltransferase
MIDSLRLVLRGESLTRAQARATLGLVLGGESLPEQTGALLAAYALRAPAADEIAGFAEAVRSLAPAPLGLRGLLDVCGTGGDGLGTFNVSTAVAFVAAAAGQPVAKHGNRAVSSRCGSFDVLEELGVRSAADLAEARGQIERQGLSFLFAPSFHSSLAGVGPIRRHLGVRTLFNLLGPLANPAGVSFQLMGVYSPLLVEPLARALATLGAEGALVVSGPDGLDELALHGTSRAARVKNGGVEVLELAPEDAGLRRAPLESVAGGDARENARILLEIFENRPGAPRDLVLLNAGAALMACGRAFSLREGVAQASEALSSGAAFDLLQRSRAKEAA